jgi:hypothetical protein
MSMALRAGHKAWPLAAAAAALAASWSSIAWATLGQPESSIPSERQASKASIKETSLGSYRVHEIQAPSGTVIREYAGLDGKVFAVTWHGPFMPNLRDALGQYFDEYAAAASSGRMDRNHVRVEQDDLVVRVGGHMRAYQGLAYLPHALPSGVSVGDLQ